MRLRPTGGPGWHRSRRAPARPATPPFRGRAYASMVIECPHGCSDSARTTRDQGPLSRAFSRSRPVFVRGYAAGPFDRVIVRSAEEGPTCAEREFPNRSRWALRRTVSRYVRERARGEDGKSARAMGDAHGIRSSGCPGRSASTSSACPPSPSPAEARQGNRDKGTAQRTVNSEQCAAQKQHRAVRRGTMHEGPSRPASWAARTRAQCAPASAVLPSGRPRPPRTARRWPVRTGNRSGVPDADGAAPWTMSAPAVARPALARTNRHTDVCAGAHITEAYPHLNFTAARDADIPLVVNRNSGLL